MGDTKPDIQVYNETDLEIPIPSPQYNRIVFDISDGEDCSFDFIEIVYVDEDEIVRINKEHLDRDYVTDIITFRYADAPDRQHIEGTMYCCAPRIFEQAEEFEEDPKMEFKRIFIHGLLHLIGYDDQTEEQKAEMTEKENTYLQLD